MANESTSTTVDREAPATEPPPRKIGADPDHKIGDDHLDAERDLTSQTADERPGSGKFAGPHARVTGVASETVDVEGETVPVLRLELSFPDGMTDVVQFPTPATAPDAQLQALAEYCDVRLEQNRFADFYRADVPVPPVSTRSDGSKNGWQLDLAPDLRALKYRRLAQKYGLLRWPTRGALRRTHDERAGRFPGGAVIHMTTLAVLGVSLFASPSIPLPIYVTALVPALAVWLAQMYLSRQSTFGPTDLPRPEHK
jgi:hypothetical protein